MNAEYVLRFLLTSDSADDIVNAYYIFVYEKQGNVSDPLERAAQGIRPEMVWKPVPVGTMGLLIDTAHPALSGFACEEYTTAQWYQIVMHSEPMILDRMSETKDIKPIVRMMDNFERNHNLGLIYEVARGNKKMLVCHADLLTLRKEYPEAECLYQSLSEYVQSDRFMQDQELVQWSFV